MEFREARLADLSLPAGVRAAAEARALLLRLGIQFPVTQGDLLIGRIKLWECVDESKVVGHCSGDVSTGEVLSLSVHPSYEGRGVGRMLLSLVVGRLRAEGVQRIWLVAPAASDRRAFGFYRAMGWRPTGEQREGDSDVLEFPPEAEL
jgi:ribosomal protein S18 acetylase RimI-like enzyme